MHLLIIKRGALGDVVRTSYFAHALKRQHGGALRLSWLTAPMSVPLLKYNPHIDDLWTSFDQAAEHRFDQVFSLDDERDALEGLANLNVNQITGAYLDANGRANYTSDSAAWFDMGLLSRFGKTRADELKKLNQEGHAQLFRAIFAVDMVEPEFYGDAQLQTWARQTLVRRPLVGINPFAGGRWPAKELPTEQLRALIGALLQPTSPFGAQTQIVLLGAGADRLRNLELATTLNDSRISVADTDDAILRLAAVIGQLDHLITSDSLAMHLGIAQRIPFTAFFAPTSAAEIDTWGRGNHVVSTAPDYCSYRKDADNASITATRILAAIDPHNGRRAAQAAHATP